MIIKRFCNQISENEKKNLNESLSLFEENARQVKKQQAKQQIDILKQIASSVQQLADNATNKDQNNKQAEQQEQSAKKEISEVCKVDFAEVERIINKVDEIKPKCDKLIKMMQPKIQELAQQINNLDKNKGSISTKVGDARIHNTDVWNAVRSIKNIFEKELKELSEYIKNSQEDIKKLYNYLNNNQLSDGTIQLYTKKIEDIENVHNIINQINDMYANIEMQAQTNKDDQSYQQKTNFNKSVVDLASTYDKNWSDDKKIDSLLNLFNANRG